MKTHVPAFALGVGYLIVAALAVLMVKGCVGDAHADTRAHTYSVIECEYQGLGVRGIPIIFCGVIPIATGLPTAAACKAKADKIKAGMRGEGAVNVSFQCVQEPGR